MKRTPLIVAALALVGLAVPWLTKANDPPEVQLPLPPLVMLHEQLNEIFALDVCEPQVFVMDELTVVVVRFIYIPGVGIVANPIVYRFQIITASWG